MHQKQIKFTNGYYPSVKSDIDNYDIDGKQDVSAEVNGAQKKEVDIEILQAKWNTFNNMQKRTKYKSLEDWKSYILGKFIINCVYFK